MPTNVVSIVSRFFKSLYSLHGQPNPTSVLDYLIFSHLQTQKWKCRGIWATLFSSRTRIVGTVHRLSHIGLLNTKYARERTPSLHAKAFVWEASFLDLREYRKVFPSCYSLSFFSFFFFLSILCWLTPFCLFSQRTPSSHNTYVFNFITLCLIYCFVSVQGIFWWTLCFCPPNCTLSFLTIKTMPCLQLGFFFFFFTMTALNL